MVENMKFVFNPSLQIMEASEDSEGKWLKIGGTALVKGVSRNKNNYTIENLEENNGKKFKWMFGADPIYKNAYEKSIKNIAVGTQNISKIAKGLG